MIIRRVTGTESACRRDRSGYARHVGRVGALAVALGAGSLLAAMPVAAADTTDSAGPAGPAGAPAVTRGASRVGGAPAAARPRAAAAVKTADQQTSPSSTAARRGSDQGAAATSRGSRGVSRAAVAVETLTGAPAAQLSVAPTVYAAPAAQAAAFTVPMGPVRAAIVAAQAYLYGYPLLAIQRVQSLLGPLNTINLNTSFADANAAPFWKAIGGGVRPNVNVLYSLAALDLTDGPVVLSIPNMGDRYYSFQLTDPYTNVDNYISSNPTAANPIGGPGPGTYAITWVGNDVDVPGAQKVLVGYANDLLLGRVEATKADQQQVVDLMNQWTLTPTGTTSINNAVIPSAYLDPISVLNAISTAITQNPPYPPEQDAAILAEMAKIGVGPDPGDPATALRVGDRLGPLSQFAAAVAVQVTAMLLPPLIDIIQSVSALQNHGWAVTRPEIGDFGTNYLYRAGVAYVGLVANTPDQALYYPGMLDANYLPLNGNRSYLLRFAPGQAPPTDEGGFWSLTVYGSDGKLVNTTTPNVYSNGPLVTRPDGSIDVILARQDPGDAGANWLEVPPGDFDVYLRIYAPATAAADGSWLPPAIQRTSGLCAN